MIAAALERGRSGEHDGGEQPAVAGLILIFNPAESQLERVAAVVPSQDGGVARGGLETPPAQALDVHTVSRQPGAGTLDGAGDPAALERLARSS